MLTYEHTDAEKKRAIEYLKQLIKIPSFSNEEKPLACYIGNVLKNMGLEVTLQEVTQNSNNVLAIIKGKKQGPNILLSGHLDTVPSMEGWETDPFTPIEKQDRLYGLGAADMKAGIAVILSVVEYIMKNNIELKGDLIIALVADEEGHSKGIKKLLAAGLKCDVAFMVEPHYYSALIGATGKMLIKGHVKGKAGHAARPDEAINAIEDAATFIANLHSIKTPCHTKIKAQPYVTLNLNGGYDTYSVTIPGSCSFIINKHTVPEETKDYVINQLKDLKERLNIRSDFYFKIGEPFYPSYVVDENLQYLKKLQEIYKEKTNSVLELEYGEGVSDSNCLVELGNIPTINFGPTGGPFHAPNEWVSKNQIFNVIEIYLKLLGEYLF